MRKRKLIYCITNNGSMWWDKKDKKWVEESPNSQSMHHYCNKANNAFKEAELLSKRIPGQKVFVARRFKKGRNVWEQLWTIIEDGR